MENLKATFEALKTVIAEGEADFAKFVDKGNKAAGVRVRKMLQEVKKQAQVVRIELNNLIKTKKE